MTTVVNNPSQENDHVGTNFLIGFILLLGMVMVFIFFGLPMLRQIGPAQITLPETKIVIPEKIDVNVTQEK